MTVSARRWPLRLALGCGLLGGTLAAAQPADPADPARTWERRCNDTLGYIGCAEMMHPGPRQPGPPPKPDVWGAPGTPEKR